MKYLILAVVMFAPYSSAQEVTVNKDGSVTLTLSKQEADKCKNGGGCVVIPVNELEPIIRETAKMMCGKSI